jgi:hypothetical protein
MPWVLDILGFFVGPKWHRMFPSNCVLAGAGRPGKGSDVEKLLHRDIGHLSDINAVFNKHI